MSDNIYFSYIKSRIKIIIIQLIFIAIFALIFYLYDLIYEPVIYAFTISVFLGFVFIIFDFIAYRKKHKNLDIIKKNIDDILGDLPLTDDLIELDYQKIIKESYYNKIKVVEKFDIRQTEMLDYYTLWAHQIKTPIAAMKLLLQTEYRDNKELSEQLFKIEQYVEMVLWYLKIEDITKDLVLEKCDLSEIIKQAVRKYANVFIRKHIILELKDIGCIVLTDEKWLLFVIEQILSNSLKYTNKGKIIISMSKNKEKTLIIEDTGIGIAKEDLPRVCEKGFTGYNGRMDKKATGIGLYLCNKILSKLSHNINIESEIDIGTRIEINISSIESRVE